jgi:hypothetical protein
MLPRLALTLALAVFVCPAVASAQAQAPLAAQPAVSTQQYDAPAYVSVVDGGATLERDGRVENAPLNMPLLSGDRLKTTDGRVEVRFADGGRLHLDSGTSLDVLSDELVRLGDGRIRLSVQRAQQVRYRVDSAIGSARITEPGEYRLAILHTPQETQLEFAVIRGAGEIFTEQGTTAVRSGERAYASAGLAPSYAYTYNSANMDEFDRWSEMQRGTVYAASSESSQHLPADMGGYASTFDQYGDWRYQQTYGYVWYPRVATGWRPYYYGRWAPYPTYGWTWITGDPFGYPTHHYGRWGFSAGLWFWIPSPYWGPAYVSWGYAPSYVSWCPLGWNNVAVFSLNYYNVGPHYYAGHYGGHYYSAWTTVPHGYFGHGYYAHQHAVNWDRPGYTGARPHFTETRTGPTTRDVAVVRGTTTPVRFGGTRPDLVAGGAVTPSRSTRTTFDTAVPRTAGRGNPPETPRFINRGDQIVRSQSERPTPPRETAVSRTAPQTAPSSASPSSAVPSRRTDAPYPAGDGRMRDNPAYRSAPPMNDGARAYGPAYDRAIPRAQAPQGVPGSGEGRTAGAPRVYDRPYAGDQVYARPYGGDRVYDRPSVGDRAYERPNAGQRTYERPPAGRVEPPRPMPMERSAPPPPPPPPAPPSGGDRAVSRPSPGGPAGGGRAGGGAPAAPAAPAAPRAGSGGAPSGQRGGGRSR